MVFARFNGRIYALFARLTVQRYNKSLTYTSILAKKSIFFEFFR